MVATSCMIMRTKTYQPGYSAMALNILLSSKICNPERGCFSYVRAN